ncbi:MAG: hypothetical protein LBD22_03355 [Spirochaetaceae bacterium]|nr:hypothetical protein [Spirochaetaceae bacterium]
MKKIARLVLFVIVCFFLVFVLSTGLSFLRLWLDAAVSVPVRSFLYLDDVLRSARWALSFALYLTVLFGVNYAQRNATPALGSFLAVVILTGGFCFIVEQGLSNARLMSAPPYLVTNSTLGNAGLMLHQRETVITLIDRPALETGSRVIAVPERPLVYQDVPLDENNEIISLPRVRFREEDTVLYNNLRADFSVSAAQLDARFDQGIVPFIAWLVPLLILLAALSYIFEVGAWPLANLFLCAVVFRLVLLLEVFLNAPSVQAVLVDFARGLLPNEFISPFLIMLCAVLFLLYDILMYFARERGKRGKA